MIQKDLCGYITTRFSKSLEPISSLSKSDKGKVLVDDKRKSYNFDKITEIVYDNKKVPASADALLATDKEVLLTEFKSGFKRKISKKNLDYSRLTCPDDKTKVCKEYGDLLIEKGNLESEELLDSLKFKAIESYITLEKRILPVCDDLLTTKQVRLVFGVVIDDYVDSMEDTLTELAGIGSSSNTVTNIKDALSRFVGLEDVDNIDYYYDEVIVFSPYEYGKYINRFFEVGYSS